MKFSTLLFLAALLPPAASLEAAPKAKAPQTNPAPPDKPAPATVRGYNALVLEAIKRMPAGGGYSVNSAATTKLVEASAVKKDANGGLALQPAVAQPSYCSGATYLVFLEVVSDLLKSGKLKLSADIIAMLSVQRQPDGAGIWGRWNANGPGTGRFFYEAGIGSNFTGLDHAQPGDFLKVWWNGHVGKKERGHSVIFIGHEKTPDGEPGIRFWSSNEPEGMSSKVVPLTKIKRALVSRLDRPENLTNLAKLAPKDPFLASMLEKECSEEEYLKSMGLAGTPDATPPATKSGTAKIVVRLDGVPDEPASGAEAPPAAAAETADPASAFMADSRYAAYSANSKSAIIQLVQMRMRYDGNYTGATDGKAGVATTASLKSWQTTAGLEATGLLDAGTLLKLGLNDLAETKMPAASPASPARNNPPARSLTSPGR